MKGLWLCFNNNNLGCYKSDTSHLVSKWQDGDNENAHIEGHSVTVTASVFHAFYGSISLKWLRSIRGTVVFGTPIGPPFLTPWGCRLVLPHWKSDRTCSNKIKVNILLTLFVNDSIENISNCKLWRVIWRMQEQLWLIISKLKSNVVVFCFF